MRLIVTLVSTLILSSSSAFAQETFDAEEENAFEQDFAIGTYLTGAGGEYWAGGVGARLRWEATSWFGFDAYADHFIVDNPVGVRHDHQVGFNAYFPFDLSDDFRLRALVGFCAVFSFIEPEQQDAPRADDILYGTHAGLGAEFSLSEAFSFFVDVQGYLYLAHDREVGGWTGEVSEDLHVELTTQASSGAQFHFDL